MNGRRKLGAARMRSTRRLAAALRWVRTRVGRRHEDAQGKPGARVLGSLVGRELRLAKCFRIGIGQNGTTLRMGETRALARSRMR